MPMDASRRRELKKIGKKLVQESSEKIHKENAERNPWPLGHPNWCVNMQAEYKANRTYRKNTLRVLDEAAIKSDTDIKFLDFNFAGGFLRHKGWYVLCHSCRALVPTACSHSMGCKCRAVVISPEAKRIQLPFTAHYSVVELVGRRPIRPEQESVET